MLPSESEVTPPPDIVIVFVAPVPEAVTLDPTKLRVVAVVDKELPSSCIVTPPPPAPAPVPAAHYCEKHKIEYTKHDNDRDEPMYAHKWNENRHWCIEGNESLIDGNGQPVTEATML